MITIEDLVPAGHFLRKLEAALDLSFVYEETETLYSRKYGRPPIDPVMIVKYLLIGRLFHPLGKISWLLCRLVLDFVNSSNIKE